MADVKKVDKTAESGGIANVAPYDRENDTSTEKPKTFSEAQTEYQAKQAEYDAQQAALKEEERPEAMLSATTKAEMAAGAEAVGGAEPKSKK